MADWDANSPELLRNLLALVPEIAAGAAERRPLSSEDVRAWQSRIMHGLSTPGPEPVGAFRGEPGLEGYEVEVAGRRAASAASVAAELASFDRTLAAQLERLDQTIRREQLDADLTADRIGAVIVLCAWAHGEWVRIHPFPNGNGRTARLLVNSIALRYGLPAFMRVRPRPGSDYALVAARAMAGDWQAAIPPFTRMYEAAL